MRTFFSQKNKWKYLSFALIGILGIGVLMPQVGAANKEVHELILEAIDSQDQIVPFHVEAKGNNMENLRLTPTVENGYSGRISFYQGAGDDVNGDGQYTPADCDARMKIDYDTNNDDIADTQAMDIELKGGVTGFGGFITIGSAPGDRVDAIYLSITNVGSSESCQATVTLLLSDTVT